MLFYIITILILAAFIGYFAIWSVSPSLHSPLMSVTNAISGLVIVGAISMAERTENVTVMALGLVAVFLSAVNVSGGFTVSERMLKLFKKKDKK